jgi:uncharacterized protein YndB with AHSA1/START domain
MSSKGLQISTPTDLTIAMTRTFDAPRPMVFEAMTNPALMRRWMLPPPGFALKALECVPRVGGALRVVWKSDDADPAMMLLGVFSEVAAPARMVHTEVMLTGSGDAAGSLLETHEFEETNGVTTMRITQVYDSKQARDGAIASGMDQGMEACFARMEEMVAKPVQAR